MHHLWIWTTFHVVPSLRQDFSYHLSTDDVPPGASYIWDPHPLLGGPPRHDILLPMGAQSLSASVRLHTASECVQQGFSLTLNNPEQR